MRKKLTALIVLAAMIVSIIPAVSAADSNIRVIFEDVTVANAATSSGEAKVKVSVEGADGNVSIAQLCMGFEGMTYKSIDFI